MPADMNAVIHERLSMLPAVGTEAVAQAREETCGIVIPRSAWCKANGFSTEVDYKAVMARRGAIMYHAHFCFAHRDAMFREMGTLQTLLEEHQLKLDRFGVSLDASMARPPSLRRDDAEHHGLYLSGRSDWDELASFPFAHPHLGDNMIGSAASYESCQAALSAGITTMGNLSQFFGWDNPGDSNVEERTRSTVMAVAAMGQHADKGARIHSNLDDGYGDKCGNLGQLVGIALLEQYIAEDLLHARLAHSFGDMFHSPHKRLVFLSALRRIHPDGVFGSMVFTNKLGREKTWIDLNDAHLCTCMLFDMIGQRRYQTGHAVTVMADCGLETQVTCQELVRKLALAKRLEDYLPEILPLVHFSAIDEAAARLVQQGAVLKNRILDCLSQYIDISNPHSVMLAVKKAGIKELVEALSEPSAPLDAIATDFMLYMH